MWIFPPPCSIGTGARLLSARADPQAPVDCFYVYPTVSMDTRAAWHHYLAHDNRGRDAVRVQRLRLVSRGVGAAES